MLEIYHRMNYGLRGRIRSVLLLMYRVLRILLGLLLWFLN